MKYDNFIKIFSIMILIFGTISFFLGFHHIDLAYNMFPSSIDIGLNKKPLGRIDIYQRGLKQLMTSLIFFITSYFLILALQENQ